MPKIFWTEDPDDLSKPVKEQHYERSDAANVAYDKACAEADHGKGPAACVVLQDGGALKKHRGIFIADRAEQAEAGELPKKEPSRKLVEQVPVDKQEEAEDRVDAAKQKAKEEAATEEPAPKAKAHALTAIETVAPTKAEPKKVEEKGKARG